jgi:hypothetical protein
MARKSFKFTLRVIRRVVAPLLLLILAALMTGWIMLIASLPRFALFAWSS